VNDRSLTLDVSTLPRIAFGPKGLIWWGTTGLMVIETTAFVMLWVTYFYVRGRVPDWPPGVRPPELRWGTIQLVILLLSFVPNYLVKLHAEKFELLPTRLWLTVTTLFALASIAVRVFEFPALNVGWDTNAYGSIVWVLIGTHTMHLVTDFYDTLVLNVIAFVGPLEKKRFVDFSDNSMYWNVIILWWIVLYVIVYIAPRYL
jgi:heme/copper-type cytochrome/quinol oxidase subunit 3